MKNISFVIPVLKFNESLEETVHAISMLDGIDEYEILIVQNGPIVSVPHWPSMNPKVTCFHISEASIPKARNFGAAKARFDLIAFLDEDSFCPTDWAQEALKFLSAPNIGAYQGPSGWGGKEMRVVDSYTLANEYFGVIVFDTGACLIKKLALNEVGGFDESFKRIEDYELATKLSRQGWILSYGERVAGGGKKPHLIRHLRNTISSIYHLKRLYKKYELPINVNIFAKGWSLFAKKSTSQKLWIRLLFAFIKVPEYQGKVDKPKHRFMVFFDDHTNTFLIKGRYGILLTVDTLILLIGNSRVLTTKDEYLYHLFFYSEKMITVDLEKVIDQKFVQELKPFLKQA